MESLTPDYRFDAVLLENRIKSLGRELVDKKFDRVECRKKVEECGFVLDKVSLVEPGRGVEFLAADSSIVKEELRYMALWAVHCVVLRGCFDLDKHRDPLIGGDIRYKNLMYDSFIDAGQIKPYQMVDEQINNIRIHQEYKSLNRSLKDLKNEGVKPDYLLVDGSLITNQRKLSRYKNKDALEEYTRLKNECMIVGLCEDSHAGDLAAKFGMDSTNIMFFDLILDEKEYVVHKKDDVYICHLKLPSKKLSYTGGINSPPLTVRWEFTNKDFIMDLNKLAFIWSCEDDLLHPQIYPLRIVDYLTRKIKMPGLLRRIIEENNLMLRYRDMRESSI
ncbi:MAG: hypothetical protein B6U97_00120 [Candidatus Altiarchaeales archaeon ex4484_96]|nr:MAG: hypothetical protein B6U97_00120 [Candidatus Altiarchaeales archaeon ex4484_96]